VNPELVASDRGPGLFVAPGVVLPDDLRIAPHVTIHANVEIGRDVSLEQGAILGRPQQLGALSRTPVYPPGEGTLIGDGCRIGSYSVVVAGARIEPGAYIGDLVTVREGCVIGERAMIGRGVAMQHGIVVGARTRIQNYTLLGPGTVIGEDVLVSPNVTFVGDSTMGRSDLEVPTGGILVRRAARIGTSAIIFPGVEIGAEAVVGAAAMVRSDVPERTVVAGTPARHLRAVRDDELIEGWRAGA
jgi:UDP-2-acetamido-3-amino-2,3-dideoxy-glucuronate N-acetyltransferase